MTIRFPGELRFKGNETDWRTNLLFPVYQVPGPRSSLYNQGGLPSKYEVYLKIQKTIPFQCDEGVEFLIYEEHIISRCSLSDQYCNLENTIHLVGSCVGRKCT